jgi:uncharacterized protein (TIGR03437 family)
MRIPTSLRLISVLAAAGGWTMLAAQTVAVDKTSMSFSSPLNGPIQSQPLNITSTPTGATISVFSLAPMNQQWLKVSVGANTPGSSATGLTTPVTVTVTVDPTGLNSGQVYTAPIWIYNAVGARTDVQVTLTISSISVSPASVTFAPYTQGAPTLPPAQTLSITGSGTFTAAASTQTGGGWLSVIPTSGPIPATVTAQLNAAIVGGLAAGTYQGTITISPVGTTGSVAVPVTLTVLTTPPVNLNPASLTFNVQNGGTNNITSKPLTITTNAGQQVGFSATASYVSGPNWITLNPTNGTTDPGTSTAQITVGYNLTGLTVGNTYQGTINVITPGGAPAQTNIPATLIYSANQLLDVPTAALNFFYQLGAATPASKTVNVTATSGTLSYSISQSANSGWLTIPNAGNTAAPFSVSVNPAGLTPGTYTATISVTSATPGSTPQQIPVSLKVTNDPALTTNVSALAFPFQIGQQAPAAQILKLSSSTGATLNYSISAATTSCGSNWLLLNGSTAAVTGSTDGSVSISVATAGLTAGTCSGSLTIASTVASSGAAAVNSPVTVPVTLFVSSTPQLVATPASLSFTAPAGGNSPAQQTVALSSTSGTDTLNYTITGVSGTSGGITWLFAGPTSGTTASQNTLSVSVFSSTLPAGTYNGTITLKGTNSGGTEVANSPVTIGVTLTVTAGSLTLSTSQLSYTYTIGGSSPANQTVTVGSSTQSALVFTAAASTTTNVPWLSVTPTSGNTNGNGTLTVSVDGTKLTQPGTYNGAITVTAPGAGNSPTVVNVTVTVSGGTLSAPTTTLSFAQVTGGPAPPTQTIAVTGSPASLAFTVAASTTPSGGTWLSATPSSGSTPGNVVVSVNGAGLSTGQYAGQIVITSTGATNSPITVPVVLNVLSPSSVTVQPTSMTFNYTVGLQVPPAQSLSVNVSSPVSITAAIAYDNGSGWLNVSPTQATASTSLAVSVIPANLAAGTYTGKITITSPSVLNPLPVPVTLVVTAIPKPVITSIGNAASYGTGGVSPGENIVIFGTGIGPADLAKNGVTNNAFGTIVGNTRVLFDGVAAPILYASATQTSVMVPYGVAGRISTNILVEYQGVQSSSIPFSVVAAAPGIYTLNQSGTGPGAILNQDGITVNGPSTPEKRGNVISVYMTGEGQTSPAGVDGAIIPPVLSALKLPVLTVTATVGNQSARVLYAGSAAGLVSGVMQVNLEIPAGVTPGNAVPIVVTVGTANSQNGVTVAVQ